MTNLSTPSLRESISSLLFEMSRKDASAFVQNVGYGFALGLLFQQNVPVPQNTLEAWSMSESQKPMIKGGAVNPITGQRIEFEKAVKEMEMT
jgi:hypothetical protein